MDIKDNLVYFGKNFYEMLGTGAPTLAWRSGYFYVAADKNGYIALWTHQHQLNTFGKCKEKINQTFL